MRSFGAVSEMPVQWPVPPRRLSFSAFREIETCPLRWGLSNAGYAADWCGDAGYPKKVNHAAIRGLVMHRVIESLLRSAVAQPEGDLGARLVAVLRQMGGLSMVINNMLEEVLGNFDGNPRATLVINQYRQGTVALPPLVGAQIQSTLRSLAMFSVPRRKTNATDKNRTHAARKGPLAPGVYSEFTLHSAHKWFGKLDIVLVKEDGVRIEEIKSGQPKLEDEEQILFYAWLWWSDVTHNPSRTPASQLAIRYPGQTTNIPAPSEHDLMAFESKLFERRTNELSAIERGVFMANPKADNCRYCQVRQLCDRYWTEILPMANPDSEMIDLEASVGRIVSPNTWEVTISNGLPYESGEQVVLKGHLPILTISTGSVLRIVDALPIQPIEDGEPRLARIGSGSEVYVFHQSPLLPGQAHIPIGGK